ncbi:MAG: M28 family peptidase [bacterium]
MRTRPRNWLLIIGILAAGSACCDAGMVSTAGKSCPASAVPDSSRLLERVRVLTQPALAGRGNGTPELLAAADTIVSWLSAGGIIPGTASGWFQDFPLSGDDWEGQAGRNVIGLVPGRGDLAGRYIVIGAHYDHLGRVTGQDPEQVPAAGEYYPGANDNASGVAVLQELARLRASWAAGAELPEDLERSHDAVSGDSSARSCLFVAFGAEEIGLQGSVHFVNNLPIPRDSLDAMINFDCVGRLTDDRLYVGGVGTAAEFGSLVHDANADSLDLALSPGGWAGSDHVAFNTIEVPVLFLFTGPYVEYNRPEDDWLTCSAGDLQRVTAYSYRLLADLAATVAPYTYHFVAQATVPTNTETASTRKAWLGTIPDFTTTVEGVQLAGVIEGSPAARAGLAKGDILVSFAGQPVPDLAGFTILLRSHQPGDQVNLELLRGGKRLHYIVLLADRTERVH